MLQSADMSSILYFLCCSAYLKTHLRKILSRSSPVSDCTLPYQAARFTNVRLCLHDEVTSVTDIEYLRLVNELNQKRIGEAKDSLETRGEELVKSNQVIADRRTDLDIKRTELEEIVSETKAEEEKLKEKAHNVEATIEPRLLSAFKRIRKNSRNGLAVVYVQRDSCGGCFNKVPPQRQLDIRTRKKIIVCEYCGRILVDPELAGVKVEVKNLEDKPRRRRVVKRREE